MKVSLFLPALAYISGATAHVIRPGLLPDIVRRQDEQVANSECFNTKKAGAYEKVYGCGTNEIKEDHYCDVSTGLRGDDGTTCESYCERYVYWGYGEERPFDNMNCNPGQMCSLTEGISVEVGQIETYSLQIGYQAFTAGASFAFSESTTTSTSLRKDRPEHTMDKCGYWTFVPYTITSCGVASKARIDTNSIDSWCADRVDEEKCTTSTMKTKDGFAMGDAIFVTTSCSSNEQLDWCFQEVAYLHGNVSYEKSLHQDAWDSAINHDITLGWSCTPLQQCLCYNWPINEDKMCAPPGFDPEEVQCGEYDPDVEEPEDEE